MGNCNSSNREEYTKKVWKSFIQKHIKFLEEKCQVKDLHDFPYFLNSRLYLELSADYRVNDAKDETIEIFSRKLSNLYLRRFLQWVRNEKQDPVESKDSFEDIKEEELQPFLERYKLPENSAYTSETRDYQLTEDISYFLLEKMEEKRGGNGYIKGLRKTYKYSSFVNVVDT